MGEQPPFHPEKGPGTSPEEMKVEKQELQITLSRDATFADLFNALDAIEEQKGLGAVHFEEELWDSFDPEVVDEILSFRGTPGSKAATTKLIDFFEEHGYTQKDVSVFLPITFKRERERKQQGP